MKYELIHRNENGSKHSWIANSREDALSILDKILWTDNEYENAGGAIYDCVERDGVFRDGDEKWELKTFTI